MSGIIYRPSGAAQEYAPFAANLYLGCSHGCAYCYAARMAVHFGWVQSLNEFKTKPRPKQDDVPGMMADFEKHLDNLARRGNPDPILLSFTTDPYQPLELDLGLTREALLKACLFRQPLMLLTKNPVMAVERDLDLIKRGGHTLGVTLTTRDPKLARALEPGAPGPEARLEALKKAQAAGVRCWISLEPLIDQAHGMDLVLEVRELGMHAALGLKSGSAYKERHDWPGFLGTVRAMFEAKGYREVEAQAGYAKEPGTYLIKQSLKGAAQA